MFISSVEYAANDWRLHLERQKEDVCQVKLTDLYNNMIFQSNKNFDKNNHDQSQLK